MRSKTGLLLGLACCAIGAVGVYFATGPKRVRKGIVAARIPHEPRLSWDDSGVTTAFWNSQPWRDPKSLTSIRDYFADLSPRKMAEINQLLQRASSQSDDAAALPLLLHKASLQLYDGEPAQAYDTLGEARKLATSDEKLETRWLYTIVFLQGVAGMRRGENEN
jgi:hypothetical protein